MIRHAIPYAAASPACSCPVQACGGIIPDPDCPDHGTRKEPAMAWHRAEDCQQVAERGRYRCASGHVLPADFRPPPTDPDDWDDTCRCKPSL